MEFLTYFIVSILAYLGIIIGSIIIIFAPEEKKGIKYFIGVNYFLFYIALLFVILFSGFNFLIIVLSLIFGILFVIYKTKQIYTAYLNFAVVFYVSSGSINPFLVISSIVFIYGLSSGAIIMNPKEKKKSFVKALYLIFFVILANILNLSL